MKITRQMLIEAGCCYAETPGKLERYVPPEGLTPLQMCDADVPVNDKLWCLLRKYGEYQPLTDRQYRLLACKWAREECVRAGWDDDRSLRAIDVAERYAGGLADKDELAELEAWSARAEASAAAWSAAWSAAWEAAARAALRGAWVSADARAEAQCRHLADIREVLTGELFAEGR